MISGLKHWLHRQQRPVRYQQLTTLLQNQQLSRAQLLEKQQQDLARMVQFASEHTRYYKNCYANLLPENLGELDITRLPVLSKDALMAHREAMVSDTADRASLRLGHTGGSTGRPLSFYYDRFKMELMRAGMCRSYMWSGWRPGEKILNFWGAKQDIKNNNLKNRYYHFIAAEQTIGAWEYGESELNDWVQRIKNYRPVLLQGYASILADVAKFIIENKIVLPRTLKGVYSTAEVLYDWQREWMETAFACKVYNQYGCREIPNIGLECRQGNIHVFTDMVYLESVNTDNEDKLLITSLTNYLMPMIRYENGDSGKLKSGDCACGSGFPMMEMGVCRSNDFIKTRSGKKIAPSYFNRLLDGLAGIRQYQFLQTEWHRLRLNLEANSPLDMNTVKTLKEKIHHDTGGELQLQIHYVDKIARSRSGKHRFVICAMPE